MRYFLAGVLTWRVPKATNKMKNPEEEPVPEDAPAIEVAAEEPILPVEDGSDAEELPLVELPDEAPGEGLGEGPGEDGSEADDVPLVQLPGVP